MSLTHRNRVGKWLPGGGGNSGKIGQTFSSKINKVWGLLGGSVNKVSQS